ncbi:hypothetical protein M422DRAFT_57707 [Sphaerobolus stellatus SS14]|nr:hypothetical protein M422DRAFT_57707 [Sphaerobolus stellatus SS14]
MSPPSTETTTTTEAPLVAAASKLILNSDKPKEAERNEGPSYPLYLPNYDLTEKWSPLEYFDHVDPGSHADKAKPNLLKNARTKDLNPYIGSVVKDIQLSQLTKEGLDELALYVAERKVVVFRDQDFKDIGPERQIEFAKHFGPIHRHATTANVKGYPEFHIVYRDEAYDEFKEYYGDNRASKLTWHSDITCEIQPPGTTIFFILDQPSVGGDTLFINQVEAYNRLSPEFKKRLEGLSALHSGVAQAEQSRKYGGPVRREPTETEHPLVRVHPVTGEKALFINPGFTRRIVGFKDEESKHLLDFLYDHITKGSDFQARATYKPGTVVLWDNRVTLHAATIDFNPTMRRHAARLTPLAEKPIPATA